MDEITLSIDERRDPEGAVGHCRSYEQPAGALIEIAPPSPCGHDVLRIHDSGQPPAELYVAWPASTES